MKNIKKMISICLLSAILISACNNENPSGDSTETLTTTTTTAEQTNSDNTQVTTTAAERTTRVAEIPEELKDSKYDLTAALSQMPLKEAYSEYFKIGVAINGNNPSNASINSPEIAAIMKYHYNGTVYSNLMKPSSLLNRSGSVANARDGNQTDVAVNFDSAIPGLEFAKENDMVMRGHTLVWHTQCPSWFFKVDYNDSNDFVDKETMLARMESYIKQVVEFTQENYPGIVYAWDVVNEAVEPGLGNHDTDTNWFARTKFGEDEDNLWYLVIGADYVEKAFEYARKYADPDVKLFYNDYNTYYYDKSIGIENLIKMLQEKDLIDGLGMQSNYSLTTPSSLIIGYNSLTDALDRYGALGIEIHMSETSMVIDGPEQFEAQAKRYRDFFNVILNKHVVNGGPANVTNVTFFGLMDEYLFYPEDTNYHWLFDKDLQPKESFFAVLETVLDYEDRNQ